MNLCGIGIEKMTGWIPRGMRYVSGDGSCPTSVSRASKMGIPSCSKTRPEILSHRSFTFQYWWWLYRRLGTIVCSMIPSWKNCRSSKNCLPISLLGAFILCFIFSLLRLISARWSIPVWSISDGLPPRIPLSHASCITGQGLKCWTWIIQVFFRRNDPTNLFLGEGWRPLSCKSLFGKNFCFFLGEPRCVVNWIPSWSIFPLNFWMSMRSVIKSESPKQSAICISYSISLLRRVIAWRRRFSSRVISA